MPPALIAPALIGGAALGSAAIGYFGSKNATDQQAESNRLAMEQQAALRDEMLQRYANAYQQSEYQYLNEDLNRQNLINSGYDYAGNTLGNAYQNALNNYTTQAGGLADLSNLTADQQAAIQQGAATTAQGNLLTGYNAARGDINSGITALNAGLASGTGTMGTARDRAIAALNGEDKAGAILSTGAQGQLLTARDRAIAALNGKDGQGALNTTGAQTTLGNTLTQGRKDITDASSAALTQLDPYSTQGGLGLTAFANSALNPNSDVFQRRLQSATNDLSKQLRQRGITGGAAIQATNELNQKMQDEEAMRQVGLQQSLANMGMTAGSQGANILSNRGNQLSTLEQNIGTNQANLSVADIERQMANRRDISNLENQYGINTSNLTVGDIERQMANRRDISNLENQYGTNVGNLQYQNAGNVANQYGNLSNLASGYGTNSSNIDLGLGNSLANIEGNRGTNLNSILGNLQNQQYQGTVNLGTALANTGLQRSTDLNTLAGLRQGYLAQNPINMTNAYGNVATNTGNNMMNLTTDLGNALAQGTVNSTNAITSGINNGVQGGVNAYNNQQMLNYLNPSNTSTTTPSTYMNSDLTVPRQKATGLYLRG